MLNAKAIILVGARDFGRCPLASRLPTALWPVLGKPVLERLLTHLADQGIRQVVVCCNGQRQMLTESIRADDRLQLEFHDELMPVGTAGCIRDAAEKTDELLIVIPANTTFPPQIDWLVNEHLRSNADLTVFLNPCREQYVHNRRSSGIYMCSSDILQYIPEVGYFDIKEGLIPYLHIAGKVVKASELQRDAGSFRNRQEYLHAVECCIDNAPALCEKTDFNRSGKTKDVLVSVKAKIESDAKVYGPAVIQDGVTIEGGAVVLGPVVLESGTFVSRNSVVSTSVLWSGTRVDSNCRIEGSVIDYDTTVAEGSVVSAESITRKPKHRYNPIESRLGVQSPLTLLNPIGSVLKNAGLRAACLKREIQSLFEMIGQLLPAWARFDKKTVLTFLGTIIVLVAFIWSYGHCILDLWDLWNESDEYSSGLLVPFMALYILWARRDKFARCHIKPSAWGILALVFVQMFRFVGLFLMYSWPEKLSVVLSIAALTLTLFGWQCLKKVSPILVFMCLMLPWPTPIKTHIGLNLQKYATTSAVFCLEVIGYEIVQNGNIIRIGDSVSVAVLEACNGLRMITAFFVISGLVVLLVDRKWWEKLIVLLSSLPIAIMCNTIRLVITSMFFTVLEGEYWEDVFHDFGGYAMMPLAIAAVVGELWLLTKLTTLPIQEEAIVITKQSR